MRELSGRVAATGAASAIGGVSPHVADAADRRPARRSDAPATRAMLRRPRRRAGVAEKQLRETLAELHRELDRTQAVDEQGRAELAAVARDIQELLDRSERTREEHASLLERLTEAMQRFEEEHPALTEAIGRVAGALSNLGI